MVISPVPEVIGRVTTENDELYYEVRGQGQPLLMISGSGGDAGFFAFVAAILADEYKVITYDRRGNSRSTRHDPQNFTMSQQCRDALAILAAVGETSAFVCGNSGGAVIALELAQTHPQAVRVAIMHEPPVARIHPDGERWQRFFGSLYHMSFWVGAQITMLRFALAMGVPMQAYSAIPADFGQRTDANHPFFIRHEMLPFSNYLPDTDLLKRNAVKLYMAAGKITLERRKFYGETAPLLAQRIGCPLVVFPGHHLSYFDMADDWAATLRKILHEAS